MNNKDYIFYLNWEDRIKNVWRVGYLAQLDEEFYFVITRKDNAESAYEKGFIGIPGFKPGEIYISSQLFDFFKNRIEDKSNIDPCSELVKTGAKSTVDSFSLEEVSELLKDKYKRILLGAYKEQERIKELRNEKENRNIERNA